VLVVGAVVPEFANWAIRRIAVGLVVGLVATVLVLTTVRVVRALR
jgi:hypothetical protein